MKVSCILDEKDTDLCTDELLKRCKTQNPNESFNAKVWSRLPKTKSYSYPTVKNVTAQTIGEHNLAFQTPSVIKHMGFDVTPSDASGRVLQRQTQERKRHSITKSKKRSSRGPHVDEEMVLGNISCLHTTL